MRVELYGCLHGTAGGNGFVYYFKDNTRTDLSILITVLSCRNKGPYINVLHIKQFVKHEGQCFRRIQTPRRELKRYLYSL